MIQFTVLGTPAPKGSARAMKNKYTGKAQLVPGGSQKNREAMRSWSHDVRSAAIAARARTLPLTERPCFVNTPLHVAIRFYLARPASHWGKKGVLPSAPLFPAKKPDIDKLVRATLDAMTGIIFDDDSRIVALKVLKLWARPSEEGADIGIMSAIDNKYDSDLPVHTVSAGEWAARPDLKHAGRHDPNA